MTQVGSIKNFEWIAPFTLSRGEQPRLKDYKILKQVGIKSIISLREAKAPSQPGWDSYCAGNENSICNSEGIKFYHVPCFDKFLPEPKSIFKSLLIIEKELAINQPVFMHCLYGLGRTGIVAAAWEMARLGYPLQQVGENFFSFFDQMYIQNEIPKDRYEAQHREYRVLAHWWAIKVMGNIFDLSTNVTDPFPAEPPLNAGEWELSCRKEFKEWVRVGKH